jgi:glucosylceramidase
MEARMRRPRTPSRLGTFGAGLVVLSTTAFSGLFLPSGQAAEAGVQVWVTTADQSKLLEPQAALPFGSGNGSTLVQVDDQIRYQSMDGFGASFTDSSASLVQNNLDEAQRNVLMAQLFDPEAGIGLSMVRQPVGASDFTVGGNDYTYDDTCCDLGDFSIDHDRAYLIPVLQQAQALNPELKLMATPWSAPAWMKDNGSLFGGQLNDDRFDEYADYLVDFVEAYEAQGLPIYAITTQNEPHHESSTYPTMRMSWEDQAEFIGSHLGPEFEDAGIDTGIIAWDHNWDEPDYPVNVLNDPEANRYSIGSAFHCYGGDVAAQSQVHDAHPDKGLWFTECSGGEWATDFGGNLKWNMQNLVIGAIRNWAKGVTLWNMALDQNAGPTNGGCSNCRGVVTVDTRSGTVAYNVEYYVLGHASKFVQPGAVRIDSTTTPGGIETVAFENPDGTIAMIALNAGSATADFTVAQGGRDFGYSMPAGAVATFVWDGGESTETPGGDVDERETYAIESVHSGRVLDVEGGSDEERATVQQWADHGGEHQRWRFAAVEGGYWRIVSERSGKVLAVTDTANGTPVVQQEYRGDPGQQWRVSKLADGSYQIISRLSGKSLDVRDVSTRNGAPIQQWDYHGGANQRWILTAD